MCMYVFANVGISDIYVVTKRRIIINMMHACHFNGFFFRNKRNLSYNKCILKQKLLNAIKPIAIYRTFDTNKYEVAFIDAMH